MYAIPTAKKQKHSIYEPLRTPRRIIYGEGESHQTRIGRDFSPVARGLPIAMHATSLGLGLGQTAANNV